MSSLSNILDFIQVKGYSNAWFEKETGIANGTLNNSSKRKGDLTEKNIDKISKRFSRELEECGYSIVDLSMYGKKGIVIVKAKKEDLAPAGNGQVEEYTPGQILTLLAKAYDKQAETISIQTKWLERIEGKMAQESTQAIMDKKINKLDDRLNEALAGIETIVDLGDEILQKFPAAASTEEPEKKRPLRDVDKKLDESVEGVHKRGKHNGGRR